ncbi:MAG: DNA-binding protein [Pseudonocardiales bacterium]|nr:MAG: DNA-binding protein [Pseudonocardiales bacterium]
MRLGAIAESSNTSGRGAPTPPAFYSVAETARLFGMSEMTLYRAIHAGQFPAVRIRGRLIVPARAIQAMVDAAVGTGGLVDASAWVPGGFA